MADTGGPSAARGALGRRTARAGARGGIGRRTAAALSGTGRALGAVAAAAGLVGLLAVSAQAAPFVDVTYDLSDTSAISTVPIIGVTTEIPPHGTIAGTQTIRYTGGSGSYTGTAGTGPTLATGAVELLTFNLTVHATVGTSVYTRYGGKTFTVLNTSTLYFEFLSLTAGASVGQRLAGGTVTPLGASGIFRMTGYLHCFKFCSAFPMPSTTRSRLKGDTFTAPLPVLTGAVGQPHTVKGTATGITFNAAPEAGNITIKVTGTNVLVGREISRTAVPEPSTLPLLGGGLAGIALAAVAWRRRSART